MSTRVLNQVFTSDDRGGEDYGVGEVSLMDHHYVRRIALQTAAAVPTTMQDYPPRQEGSDNAE